MPEITGTVINITFESDKKNYSVFKLKSHENSIVCVVANSLAPMIGENIVAEGDWSIHPRYGRQFSAISWNPDDSRFSDNIALFLKQCVNGIGEKLAARIVAEFGPDLLEVMTSTPEKLAGVRGVSLDKAAEIGRIFADYNEIRNVKLFLEKHGVSGGFAPQIVAVYGAATESIVLDNPYRLCEDFDDIGFAVSDCIARRLGVGNGDMQRMRAGINYALLQSFRDGHCCYPRTLVIRNARKHLDLPPSEIDEEIAAMQKDGDVIVDFELDIELVYLPFLFHTEQQAAVMLHRINASAEKFADNEITALLTFLEKKSHIALAENQRQAVASVLNEGITIITGGPGTGKTTIIRCIRELFEHCGLEVVLAAPTGRAARRLGEAAGGTAVTVHRLLEAQGTDTEERFLRNADNPLQGDIFVIDEASMLDIVMLKNLLDAFPAGARLVLVGDSDQLPPVGAGMVLRDLLRSGVLPFVKLDEIFRQAAGSAIVQNSHRIRKGIMPLADADDFGFCETGNAAETAEKIVEYCVCKSKQAADAVSGIQVLAPMYRAECGVECLNRLLQDKLNNKGEKVIIGGENTIFRVGDKVMQTKNDYEKAIYNGDIGIVAGFADNGMIVDFYDNMVRVEPEQLRNIQLAYAITVHKSQGSEYPIVILALSNEHAALLGRSVLYTAVTRAKNKFIAFGSAAALRRAVVTERTSKRWTTFETRVRRAGDLI